jgi:diaminopimelate decarboxylase
MLLVGGCRADDLATEFGTPVLVVSEAALRSRARAGGEILTALKAGVDPALVVLHGNAKSDEEIAMAVEHDLGLVVVDNADDIDRLEATVRSGHRQEVLVRVIPGVTADTHAHVLTGHEGSKFGLSPATARELISRIERSSKLTMRGLHVHVGSQILDVGTFAESVVRVAALGEFSLYDLGGGLGARYTWTDQPPSVGDYLDALVGAAREHLPFDAEIIIEPGRSMVASAATTLYRVLSSAARSRSWRSTVGWATTSRWHCSTSGSRPDLPTASTSALMSLRP